MIDTIAACGDVNRNVLACANPVESRAHAIAYEWARKLSEHFLPHTRAYHEIWLDGEKVEGTPDVEPIYGPTYLPRKFKTAIAVPPFNDVDIFANDLGFIAIVENGELQGFNLTVGGGLGTTHGDALTYPRLADVVGFLKPEQLLAVAEAVVTTQRDFGDRATRKHARLKYTIDERGLDWFVAEITKRQGFALEPARPFEFTSNGDRFGWVEGYDGRWHLTLRIEAGRIADGPRGPNLTGLREIAKVHRGDFRLTPNQNLVIANVDPAAKAFIDALVVRYGLDRHVRATPVARDALACVALPTCALAMAEAERYLPRLTQLVDERLTANGLAGEPLVAAHHRLPERLRATVPRGGRADRQGARPLQPVFRRRRPRAAAQRIATRERRRAHDRRGPGSGVRGVRPGPSARRALRRLRLAGRPRGRDGVGGG